GASNGIAVERLLEEAQQRVHRADAADDGDHVEVRTRNGEAIAGKEAKPRREVATLPDAGRPLPALLRRRRRGGHAYPRLRVLVSTHHCPTDKVAEKRYEPCRDFFAVID